MYFIRNNWSITLQLMWDESMFLNPSDYSSRPYQLGWAQEQIWSYVKFLLPHSQHFRLRWCLGDLNEKKRLFLSFGRRMRYASEPYRTLMWIAKNTAKQELNEPYRQVWSSLSDYGLADEWWYLMVQW